MFTLKVEDCFAYVHVGKHSFLMTIEKPQYPKQACRQINPHGFRGNWGNTSGSEIPICPRYVSGNHANLLADEYNSCYIRCGLLENIFLKSFPIQALFFCVILSFI